MPRDKREIPTTEIAPKFKHLRAIADQIRNANTEILIGRDLVKASSFLNGPRGAPWAEKLVLKWTISGQVCLDRINGKIHISVKRTIV